MAAPLVVHGLPSIWGLPSPSPFVNKLLTWLRMAKLEYRYEVLTTLPQSQSGKVPYVTLPTGETLSDSSVIIAHLAQEKGLDLDRERTPAQRAQALVLQRLLEEHTYFIGAYERFLTPEGWAHTSVDYFRHLPAPMRWLVPRLVRRRMRANLRGQGLGRQSLTEIHKRAREDLRALREAFVGPYVLGPRSTVDATVFAFLWGFRSVPFESVLKSTVRADPVLTAYVDRMCAELWP